MKYKNHTVAAKSLLLLMLLTSCTAQSIYYVTPSPDTPCPGEPCHTLSEYATDQYFENLTGNTTVEFLPGNHTLEQTISVINVAWLTLHGDSSSLPEVTSSVVCTQPSGIVFENITELYIGALAFNSCGHHYSAAVSLISVKQSEISNCSFLNNTLLNGEASDQRHDCNGGALYIQNSCVILKNNEFQHNYAENGGALYMDTSKSIITRNTFKDNTVSQSGALYAVSSNLSLTRNAFLNNSGFLGGAIMIEASVLNMMWNTFRNNIAQFSAGALSVNASTINLTWNTFQNSFSDGQGGALYVHSSTLNLTSNVFQNISSYQEGGILIAIFSTLILTRNTFNHSSGYNGGALYVHSSTLNLTSNVFQNISSYQDGGVLIAIFSTLILTRNTFNHSSGYDGGALYVVSSTLNLTSNTFQDNSAVSYGGVLCIYSGQSILTRNQNNNVDFTGEQVPHLSTLNLIGNRFENSSAENGGAILLASSTLILTNNTFQNHSAVVGGVMFVNNNSTVRTYGSNVFANSTALYGGGIAASDSDMKLSGTTNFESNTASYGGGLYVDNTEVTGNMSFANNSANKEGGGVYALQSTFTFIGESTITGNLAMNGGGLLLSGDSKFYLQPNTHVHFINNSAENGGAIKIEDTSPLAYCTPEGLITSACFFQTVDPFPNQYCLNSCNRLTAKELIDHINVGIVFDKNTAIKAGADIHGGSVDNCKTNILNYRPQPPFIGFSCCLRTSGKIFDGIISSENPPGISSDSLSICTCRENQTDCSGSYYPDPVYPGGTVEVPVIARGQRNGTTPAVIEIISTDNSSIIFQTNEIIQNANHNCTVLRYTIQSYQESTTHKMTLYAKGPCLPADNLPNTLTVFIDIQHCPPGFQISLTQPKCICAKRLQKFTNSCTIDDNELLRARNAVFWVGYDNQSQGLIIHPHCPFDHCTSEETYLTVDDSDKQCNYNRSGLLCGACGENLSLTLGSSRCLQCSNSYLLLLAAFTLEGIALVLFLLVLRLTVAAGTINGLIFYANVVTVNSAIFFKTKATNILTVFIAWLNLDLGIETCFYNGMDAYVKTWLQFVFPMYLWALMGMITIGSYYSGRVGRIFGSNPVAVLATLFLLSYAKLLRTIIAALSYTYLEYPDSTPIAVWLYDGNIRYLSGKHIPLFMAAIVCLIVLFLPYTLLLIFAQWLNAKQTFPCTNNRYVQPFLDAYHAPYSSKHRYWTGLMLLLRFVLFLITAVNTLGDPRVNLLAVGSAVILTLPTILSTGVYKTWCLGLLETSFLLNLAILALATLYIYPDRGNQKAVTFTSVGIAFATFTGIVIHHSIQQIKGTQLWKRVFLGHNYMRVPLTNVDSGPEDPPDTVYAPGSAPTQTDVDIWDHQLREPCMTTN